MQRVAIIEDDKLLNDKFRQLIEKTYPVSVAQFYDRTTAETALSKERFDLVIADIDLGEHPKDQYGGLSILASLKGLTTVTLVVSGMPEENLPRVALSLSAFDFIEKPADPHDLLNKVGHALELHNGKKDSKLIPTTHEQWPTGLEPDPERNPGIKWQGKAVNLSLTQLRLVKCLILNPGCVVDYKTLEKQLDSTNSKKAIATHLAGVRQRFRDVDQNFDQIDSEPRKGYVWKTNIS